jgi:hypothetical protein
MNAAYKTSTLIAIATAAVAVSSPALAAGEPKNTLPFTRSASATRTPAQATSATHQATAFAILGEPKNQLPFTRR